MRSLTDAVLERSTWCQVCSGFSSAQPVFGQLTMCCRGMLEFLTCECTPNEAKGLKLPLRFTFGEGAQLFVFNNAGQDVPAFFGPAAAILRHAWVWKMMLSPPFYRIRKKIAPGEKKDVLQESS